MPEENGRLWAKIIIRGRTRRQCTVRCRAEEAEEAMTEVSRELDIERPLWLKKHTKEFQDFRHTSFLPEHFMETIPFDRLEIEFLPDDIS